MKKLIALSLILASQAAQAVVFNRTSNPQLYPTFDPIIAYQQNELTLNVRLPYHTNLTTMTSYTLGLFTNSALLETFLPTNLFGTLTVPTPVYTVTYTIPESDMTMPPQQYLFQGRAGEELLFSTILDVKPAAGTNITFNGPYYGPYNSVYVAGRGWLPFNQASNGIPTLAEVLAEGGSTDISGLTGYLAANLVGAIPGSTEFSTNGTVIGSGTKIDLAGNWAGSYYDSGILYLQAPTPIALTATLAVTGNTFNVTADSIEATGPVSFLGSLYANVTNFFAPILNFSITNINNVTFDQTFAPSIGDTFVTNFNTFFNTTVFSNIFNIINNHPITSYFSPTNNINVGSVWVTNYLTYTNIINVTNITTVTFTNITEVTFTNNMWMTNVFNIGATTVIQSNTFNNTNNVILGSIDNHFTYGATTHFMYEGATTTAMYVEMYVGGLLATGTLDGGNLKLYWKGGGSVTQAVASINEQTNAIQRIIGNYPIQVTSLGGDHTLSIAGSAGIGYGYVNYANSATFLYKGNTQQFGVGSTTSIVIQIWAAAGGTGAGGGQPAGYTEIMLTVTNNQILDLVVGEGGEYKAAGTTSSTSRAFGGGGRGISGLYGVGGGGGASAVFIGTNLIAIAGGGGGAAQSSSGSSGGGVTGGGNASVSTGAGGSQTNGGAAATLGGITRSNLIQTNTAGTFMLGGDGGMTNAVSQFGSGGGGGGYYGGGGGWVGSGGGGSGYVNSSFVSYGITVRGAFGTAFLPPAAESPWYPTGYSPPIGTVSANNQRGGHGAIVIRYP